LIEQDKIALGGDDRGGFSMRGHVPEKDGILACLLTAEMIAVCGVSLAEQLRALFKRVGREYWPLRTDLHLTEDVKSKTVKRLKADFSTFLGRRVAQIDRVDGLKLEFDNGSWVLLRLSETKPRLKIYTEAATLEESSKIASQTEAWIMSTVQEAKA
jgi:phosphomannomutase